LGANRTLTVQLAPAARVNGQLLVWVNWLELLPPKEMPPLIPIGPVPVLDTVTVCAGLVVLLVMLPNASESGDT